MSDYTFDYNATNNITFIGEGGKEVGKLLLDETPVRFEGDLDESAKVFFDAVASQFNPPLVGDEQIRRCVDVFTEFIDRNPVKISELQQAFRAALAQPQGESDG